MAHVARFMFVGVSLVGSMVIWRLFRMTVACKYGVSSMEELSMQDFDLDDFD